MVRRRAAAADGTITETTDKNDTDDMPGFAYSGGYLFSGKLVEGYNYKHGYDFLYYLAKTVSHCKPI